MYAHNKCCLDECLYAYIFFRRRKCVLVYFSWVLSDVTHGHIQIVKMEEQLEVILLSR
jgi:hypothetical protein